MASFKVAVLQSVGAKTLDHEIRQHHFVVPSSYDFSGNSAVDVTSVSMLGIMFSCGRLDYKNYRASLALNVASVGFQTLTEQGKREAALQFVVSKTDRDLIFTVEEQVENGAIFHSLSISCREERYRRAASEVYNRLAPSEAAVIVGAIIARGLDTLYKQYGIEGTPSGDVEGLYDFLAGTAGTTYASGGSVPGLPHRGFLPIGMTLQELSDRILVLLRGEA